MPSTAAYSHHCLSICVVFSYLIFDSGALFFRHQQEWLVISFTDRSSAKDIGTPIWSEKIGAILLTLMGSRGIVLVTIS